VREVIKEMKTRYLAFLVAVVVAVSCVTASGANSVEAVHEGLRHYLATDQYQYTLSDSVQITYSVTNVTEDPIHILMSYCLCEIWVSVHDPDGDSIWGEPRGCPAEVCWETLEPGESYLLNPIWDMMDLQTGQPIETPGVYTVEGELKTMDPALYFGLLLEIEIVDASSGVPETNESLPATWSLLKTLYR
jgi:hypothetical protein